MNDTIPENIFKANTYKNKPKAFAIEKISDIQSYFFDHNINFKNQLVNYQKLVNAISAGLAIELPEGLKNERADVKITKLYEILSTSTAFNKVLEDTVLPFLKETDQNCSFTLTVGPGEDYIQMYPHDDEFQAAVFDRYPRNAVFIFEGGAEAEFADNYTAMFDTDEIAIPFNTWAQGFLEDLATEFSIEKESIGIEKLNDQTILFHILKEKSETLFVLYKGDYVRGVAEESLSKILAVTKKNFLLCGIRHGDCADIFLRDSSLFYNNFDFYLFTHGKINKKNLNERNTSYRFNLKRLRNRMTKKNTYNQLTHNKKGKEATAYGTSTLCNTETRKPNTQNPYCVKGVKNEEIFWKGLGGKREKKRQTKKVRKQ